MWKAEHRAASDRRGLHYPSDLTDAELALIAPMIPPAKHGGRHRTVCLREVLNAIFYDLSSGCQWKALPKDLPPKSIAHSYFMLWDWDGTLERVHEALYVAAREQAGREASPQCRHHRQPDRAWRPKRGASLIRRAMMRAKRRSGVSGTFSSTRSASC